MAVAVVRQLERHLHDGIGAELGLYHAQFPEIFKLLRHRLQAADLLAHALHRRVHLLQQLRIHG